MTKSTDDPKRKKTCCQFIMSISKQDYRVKTISTDFNGKTKMLTIPPNCKLFFHKRFNTNNGSKCWLFLFSLSIYTVFRSYHVNLSFKFICTLVTTQSATTEPNRRNLAGLGTFRTAMTVLSQFIPEVITSQQNLFQIPYGSKFDPLLICQLYQCIFSFSINLSFVWLRPLGKNITKALTFNY